METDVVVVGGGATGLGVAWDLALRGVRVALAEMGAVATGTTGRYHGLLHSGARYAVSDPESARECIQENMTLRRVAAQALEDTGGLFVLAPGDDESFAERWIAGCRQAGIPIQEISPSQALQREPMLNPGIRRAFEVPDATCDPFALGAALQRSAEARGAKFFTFHRVEGFQRKDGRIHAVRLHDLRSDETRQVGCRVVVIAAGPWSGQVGELARVTCRMNLSRGTMIGFNGRWVNTVINRLRKPGDGDIFLPLGTMAIAGTTSVATDDPGDPRIEPWEVERIISETETFLPRIRQASILRAWAGVRPLYDPELAARGDADAHADARAASRTFSVLDHAEIDGVGGLVTVVGGKLTTFRLMAEKTADLVCQKLGIKAECTTAITQLATAGQAVPK